ncbi:hypothetical protein ABH940_003379 [Streptacidiphilus sp. BW17]|uniref:hypothetical protein n=1 Tax=Streptacidiphilus sp. BW17 TaxID=3156274 RepID=UPI0035186AE4
MPNTPSHGPLDQAMKAIGSPTVGNVLAVVGLITPFVGLFSHLVNLKVLFVVETVVVLLLFATLLWTRSAYLQLRRANTKLMSDGHFFDLMRSQLEQDLIDNFGDIADGHLQVYATEVARLSVMLFATLQSSQSQPRRVLAADLTTSPNLLTQRREYLNANRRFIEDGGQVNRLFICYLADLAREDYARRLLELVDHHRSLGVTCGIAVRDRLRADQAVDFVVFSAAAVLVEEEQGDADYTRGRSSVYFRQVERWTGRFESVWGHGSASATFTLQGYEAAVRPMLISGAQWDGIKAKAATGL